MQNGTTRDKNKTQVLHADPEHGRLRAAVLVLMVTAVGGAFLLLNWLLPPVVGQTWTPLVPCLGALPLGLGLAWLGEQWLQRVWPSGKTITILPGGLRVDIGASSAQQTITWQNLSFTGWHFTVGSGPQRGREQRLRSKWVCLAGELTQAEQRLIVYSYMPPADANRIMTKGNGRFFQALSYEAAVEETNLVERVGPAKPPHIPSNALAGNSGRLWLAERSRLQTGLELRPKDFEILVTAVAKNS